MAGGEVGEVEGEAAGAMGVETPHASGRTKTRPRHQAKGGGAAEASILVPLSSSWRSSGRDNSSDGKEEVEEENEEMRGEEEEVQSGHSAQALTFQARPPVDHRHSPHFHHPTSSDRSSVALNYQSEVRLVQKNGYRTTAQIVLFSFNPHVP